MISFIFTFLIIMSRIWWLQTVEADKIIEYATEQQWKWESTLKPKRGMIMDRNGEILAYEGKAYTVNARLKPLDSDDKNYVQDPYYTAVKLSLILNAPVDELLNFLTKTQSKVVLLGRYGNKITEEQKNSISALQSVTLPNGNQVNQLPGVYLTETTRRVYPNNSFATHVLGFLNFEDKPIMGLELQLDTILKGEKGEREGLTDGAGYLVPEGEIQYKPAKDGNNIYLTIDRQIQNFVELALDKVEKEYNPKGMTVLVSDPQTGEILAMGNRPQFNPNTYFEGITNYTNHAVTTMFEPGSTFKIITLAAAIEEGLFNPNETYMSGMYKKFNPPIRDHNNGVGWRQISFLEGVQRSSNVAFAILGFDRLKPERLRNYFEKFGMGKITGIELPYEKKGNLRNVINPPTPRDIAVTTFGQGVTVTAIQQVAAVGAIANGGELLKPHIIKEIRDQHSGAVIQRSEREVIRRVVKESTAKEVRDILESVVSADAGTGHAYAINGYKVSGKTGTAQKYDPNTGTIVDGRYIVSFIGFAPKDNPRLLVYVVVDDPETDESYTTWGKQMVAPIFTSVMESSLKYLEQQPELHIKEDEHTESNGGARLPQVQPINKIEIPKFIGMSTSRAKLLAKEKNLSVNVLGTGTKVINQFPEVYEDVMSSDQVTLVTDRLTGTKMPNFIGKSLRDVMEFTSLMDIQVAVTGTGFVSEQSIKPNELISGGEKLKLTLKPLTQEKITTSEKASP